MKKIPLLLIALVLLGAGCISKSQEVHQVSIATINSDPETYQDQKVELTGVLNVRRSICTEMACMFTDDECEAGERIPCNDCNGEMLLQEVNGASILLSGVSCKMQEYVECNVGTVYEVEDCDLDLKEGEEYTLNGMILIENDIVTLHKPNK